MGIYRNLELRPAGPALGNGRCQRAAFRAFVATGRAVLTTEQALAWTHAGRLHRGEKITSTDRRHARAALDRVAIRVGRAPTNGRPILWKLKDEYRD
jgi:hypothetical protein